MIFISYSRVGSFQAKEGEEETNYADSMQNLTSTASSISSIHKPPFPSSITLREYRGTSNGVLPIGVLNLSHMRMYISYMWM